MTNNLATTNHLPDGTLGLFIDKLKDWKFNIPSKNLWTVTISLHNDGSENTHTLGELYKNINKANDLYGAQIGTLWSVTSASSQTFENDFITKLSTDKGGLFLAQGVSYEPHSANINTNASDTLSAYAGYMTFGAISNGKSPGSTLNIQFLETNWSIADILFEKWIAAYIQQGGIEDSNLPNIKADIYVNEYAHSVPQELHRGLTNEWQLRKIIKFIKCVPTKRSGDTTLTSDAPSQPGIATIEFNYQDYSIKYMV